MAHKTRQLRGSLMNLLSEIKRENAIIGELLQGAVQESVKAIQLGKDHRRVADFLVGKADIIYQHKERFE